MSKSAIYICAFHKVVKLMMTLIPEKKLLKASKFQKYIMLSPIAEGEGNT